MRYKKKERNSRTLCTPIAETGQPSPRDFAHNLHRYAALGERSETRRAQRRRRHVVLRKNENDGGPRSASLGEQGGPVPPAIKTRTLNIIRL